MHVIGCCDFLDQSTLSHVVRLYVTCASSSALQSSLKITGNVTIRWSAYDFLLDFNRNYVSILYNFPVIYISYLSKVAYFNIPIG